ncbi:MAG: ABC-type transport auxiliary lipoprotein family protein [Aquabacterium sp.]
MRRPGWTLGLAVAVSALFAGAGTGCGSLLPAPAPAPAFFALEGTPAASGGAVPAPPGAPALVVSPPRAAAGYDSARIVYTRKAHQLETYALSEWVDTPARMLGPLIVTAIGRHPAFRVVMASGGGAVGELRLDTELLRLRQEFGTGPSRVSLVLRATVVDSVTRRLVAHRDFDIRADASTEDAYGGVQAANRATGALLQALAAFCAEAAGQWQSDRARAASGH